MTEWKADQHVVHVSLVCETDQGPGRTQGNEKEVCYLRRRPVEEMHCVTHGVMQSEKREYLRQGKRNRFEDNATQKGTENDMTEKYLT